MQKKTEKNGKLPLEFCKLMRGLHSAPASSASLEHVFSTFGLVWSKLRNRLDPKKAENWLKSIDICEESSLTGSSTVACADMNND